MKFKRYVTLVLLLCAVVFLTACSSVNYNNVFEGITLPEETITDITLPRYSLKNPDMRIGWVSSDARVIDNQGRVLQANETKVIEMEAFIVTNAQRLSQKFNVKVPGLEGKSLSLSAYQSDYGFASRAISSRHTVDTSKIVVVNNEIEFLDALKNKSIKVIKIENDLNMGANHVRQLLIDANKTEEEINQIYMSGSFYRQHPDTPISHPTLKTQGVGQMIIQGRTGADKGLMIYSEKGITIKHLTTQIKDADDIVIRNIHFTGIWEWDDDLSANYDLNDWDYFTIEKAKGLWLDHLTLDQSYDGLVDVKGGTENFTLSYFKLIFEHNAFIQAQIDELEHKYQQYLTDNQGEFTLEELKIKSAATSRYAKLRLSMSVSEIAEFASLQKKGFNFGNTTQGIGFDTITITMHNFLIKNLQDRLPRLRQGDAHLYNMYLDASKIVEFKAMVTSAGDKLVNQAIVPTEEAAVLLENSKFIDITEPIKNHQDSTISREFTGRYAVKNSILFNGSTYYKGNSGELDSPWGRSNTNIDWDLEFYFRNHQEIPYQYENQLLDPALIHNTLVKNHVGAGPIEGLEWMRIRNVLATKDTVRPYHRLDKDAVEIPNVLIDLHDTTKAINSNNGQAAVHPYVPVVKNFYGGIILQKGTDYTVEVDQSKLDKTKPGTYQVTYKISSLANAWDTFEISQEVVIYDGQGTNEIYTYKVTDEFDAHISVDLKTYGNVGTLYYLVSSDEQVNKDILKQTGHKLSLTNVQTKINDIPTQRNLYIYMVVEKDGKLGTLVKHRITSEIVVYISTIEAFNQMLEDGISSKNRYYILENDLDYTGKKIPELTTEHKFSGVFDGNGKTIKNIKQDKARGGIFFTIENGYIKNLVLDNIFFEVKEHMVALDPELPNQLQVVKAQDDAGLLATYTYTWAKIENVVIKNSGIGSSKNYVGSFIGRVRTGTAYFDNLSVNNVALEQKTTDATYLGGFIGGAEANTTVYMSNLYAKGLKLKQRVESQMVGGVLGRARSYTYINQVVIFDLEIESRHNIGLIAGKEEATLKLATIKDIFIQASVNMLPDNQSVYTQYFGYIYGNPDARYQGTGVTTVSNVYVTAVNGFDIAKSKGNNDATVIANGQIIDANWWKDHLPLIVENDLWEMSNQQLRLKNSVN